MKKFIKSLPNRCCVCMIVLQQLTHLIGMRIIFLSVVLMKSDTRHVVMVLPNMLGTNGRTFEYSFVKATFNKCLFYQTFVTMVITVKI